MRQIRVPALLWLASAGVKVASAIYFFGHLPDRVATHFGASGRANGWMSRSQNLTFDIVFGLGMPIFLVALLFSLRFIPISLWNIPNKDIWSRPDNHRLALDYLLRSSLWLAWLTTMWITFLSGAIWHANQSTPPVLQNGPLLLLSGVYLAGIVWWLIALLRFFNRNPVAPG